MGAQAHGAVSTNSTTPEGWGQQPPRLSTGGREHNCKGSSGEELRGPAVKFKSGGLAIFRLDLEGLSLKKPPARLFIARQGSRAVQSCLSAGPWKDPLVLRKHPHSGALSTSLSSSGGAVARQDEHDN